MRGTRAYAILGILCICISPSTRGETKSLTFGGYDWLIKETRNPIGPGPNLFSARSIKALDTGLILSITARERLFAVTRYFSAEVYTKEFFSYGMFELDFRRKDRFDSHGVFGFFLYNNDNPPYYSEVDFEAARWGIKDAPEGQFTVQPYEREENFITFPLPTGPGTYRVRIHWQRQRIDFSLHRMDTEKRLAQWTYTGDALPLMDGKEDLARVHINFWLFQGKAPAQDGELSVDLLDFRYLQ